MDGSDEFHFMCLMWQLREWRRQINVAEYIPVEEGITLMSLKQTKTALHITDAWASAEVCSISLGPGVVQGAMAACAG